MESANDQAPGVSGRGETQEPENTYLILYIDLINTLINNILNDFIGHIPRQETILFQMYPKFI